MENYTNLKQSKKLAEILPLESADMYYHNRVDIPDNFPLPIEWKRGLPLLSQEIPCWSLAALSEFILPYIADDDGNNYKFYLSKDGLDRWIAYYKSDDVSIHICEESYNMIDVILEMVCWLKENNKL